MQELTKRKKLQIGSALLLAVTIFAMIRYFEKTLFYDPLLYYFKGDYKQKAFPDIDLLKWSFHTFVRFFLNTLVSLFLVWIFFRSKEIIRLLMVIYALFFVVLMSLLSVLIVSESPSTMLLFYCRRFLIQPVLVMLFIPAIYFHLSVVSKK